MATLILSIVGSDRPGLTQALAAAVLSAGGNWLESHLSRLGGLYVGSVLVELATDSVDALRTAIREVDAQGFLVNAFADTVAAKYAMNVVRFLGGALYLTGGVIMAYNLWATVAKQPKAQSTAIAIPAE